MHQNLIKINQHQNISRLFMLYLIDQVLSEPALIFVLFCDFPFGFKTMNKIQLVSKQKNKCNMIIIPYIISVQLSTSNIQLNQVYEISLEETRFYQSINSQKLEEKKEKEKKIYFLFIQCVSLTRDLRPKKLMISLFK